VPLAIKLSSRYAGCQCEGHDTSTKTVVFCFLVETGRVDEFGVDARDGALRQWAGDDPVELHVVALRFQPVTVSAAVPPLGNAAAAPAGPNAAAVRAPAATVVMTIFFTVKPFCGRAGDLLARCCMMV